MGEKSTWKPGDSQKSPKVANSQGSKSPINQTEGNSKTVEAKAQANIEESIEDKSKKDGTQSQSSKSKSKQKSDADRSPGGS